jgi:hypothetical protein
MNQPSGNRASLPIKEAVKQQFETEILDNRQMNQLLDMQRSALEDGSLSAAAWHRQLRYRAFAACALLLVGIAILWQPVPSPGDITNQIALEVAENHLKLKPLDITAQSMQEIRGFFTQLDFSPINSSLLSTRFALPEQRMIGGRYCSIKGVTAAQPRYQRSDDGLSTLYQVAYDPDTHGPLPHLEHGEAPDEIIIKGLHINLWVEKGLLMALVQDS